MKEIKKCSKCKKNKAFIDFGASKQTKDGLKCYCKECKRKESAAWRDKNPDYNKTYRDQNRAEAIDYSREYYKENKEELYNRKKVALLQNPERQDADKKRKKEWYKANKSKTLEGKRRRRARILGCDENYTKEDERITFVAFSYKCFNCSSEENLCVDHHRPLIKGNPLSLKNAVVLCKTCNLSKGTKDPEIFYGIKRCAELDTKLAQIKGE